MQSREIVCPECNGRGEFNVIACPGGEYKLVACALCRGDGYVSEETANWRNEGAELRAQRVARGESLREMARRTGIGPAKLSDMEHGRADPSGLAKAEVKSDGR